MGNMRADMKEVTRPLPIDGKRKKIEFPELRAQNSQNYRRDTATLRMPTTAGLWEKYPAISLSPTLCSPTGAPIGEEMEESRHRVSLLPCRAEQSEVRKWI